MDESDTSVTEDTCYEVFEDLAGPHRSKKLLRTATANTISERAVHPLHWRIPILLKTSGRNFLPPSKKGSTPRSLADTRLLNRCIFHHESLLTRKKEHLRAAQEE